MSYIKKRNGKYRARYRDPLGRMTSTTFESQGRRATSILVVTVRSFRPNTTGRYVQHQLLRRLSL